MTRCFQEPDWKDYVAGQTDPRISRIMEEHLLECDACLSRYTTLCEQNPASEPPVSFAEQVMESVREIDKPVPQATRSSVFASTRKKLILHYTIAASITILLTSTGLFHDMVKTVQATENTLTINLDDQKSNLSRTYGWTNQLMDQTLSVFDFIKEKD
ncbi:MAG: hypothetical protein H0Z33_11455 [Bacillaceae bacterium]|nr:hypothetical protein [Bacillaceae bacterium]